MVVVRTQVATSLVPAAGRLDWPSVGVVLVTRDRPHLLRRALDSIAAQDYPGPMRVVVVYDGAGPDWRVAAGGERPVLVLENWRRGGTAGARNTGVLAVGDCELVAFCDDRDTWTPAKLSTQVAAMRTRPEVLACTCAAEVEYGGLRIARLAGLHEIRPGALTPDRAAALRSSSLVARQAAMTTHHSRGGIGLFAEGAPSLGAAWDLLVRAARRAPILHLDTPLVRVLWRRPVIDRAACRSEIAALRWMVEHHPELTRRRRTAVALYRELACWHAAAADHAGAWQWTIAAVLTGGLSLRTLGAAAAASGLRGRGRLARRLRRRG